MPMLTGRAGAGFHTLLVYESTAAMTRTEAEAIIRAKYRMADDDTFTDTASFDLFGYAVSDLLDAGMGLKILSDEAIVELAKQV